MTFVEFANAHGLIIEDLVEGQWKRVRTTDKPKKRNGSYKYLGDVGFVQNHATMPEVAMWKNGARAGTVDRAAMQAMRVLNDAAERARQSEARAKAAEMMKRAGLDKHPYLAAKGFPDEMGLVLDGELLIPMREFGRYSQTNSLQRISADGTKLFLAGGKAKGAVFLIGPTMAQERWLVEGYATGLSVRAALRLLHREAQVVVCFSAGNLSHVGRLVKQMRTPAFVFADNDKSGAGAKAAAETGLSFVMTAELGDANDLHASRGVRALATLIRQAGAVRRQEEAA